MVVLNAYNNQFTYTSVFLHEPNELKLMALFDWIIYGTTIYCRFTTNDKNGKCSNLFIEHGNK